MDGTESLKAILQRSVWEWKIENGTIHFQFGIVSLNKITVSFIVTVLVKAKPAS